MQILSASIDSIRIGERHRALSEDAVARLVESINVNGLRQPISVRIGANGDTVLVAGRHRLEAFKRLGKPEIDCIEVADDEIKAEMWEIAENLHRLDLTNDQRDEHIRRYTELLAAADLISQQNASKLKTPSNPKGAGRPEGTVSKVAKATGLSKDTVRRALDPKPRPAPPPRRNQSAAGKQLNALKRAWRQASKEVREIFLRDVARAPATSPHQTPGTRS
jgi:ParB-like chromosome segregation protein Spo0J